jgi:hypothetical protein
MKKQLLFSLVWLTGLGMLCDSLPALAKTAPAVHHQAGGRAVAEERTLVVYPNPSTGIVHLTINGLEGRRAEITVLNVIGTVMYRETLTELSERSTKTLDLSKFANGLYYVKLEADNSSQLCKFIIR